MRANRIRLGKTAQKVLDNLHVHGPIWLSHGSRYAEIGSNGARVMMSTNHLLRATGMVEWAGGNYGSWHVRITEYGEECRRRGWHDGDRRRQSTTVTYGPRADD